MTDALTRLADAVEAGGTGWNRLASIAEDVMPPKEAALAATAYHGSLDAAKALHEAVLPGWDWSVDNLGRSPTCAAVYDGSKTISAFNPNPARAWLMAIIRALAQVQK